MKSRLKKYIKDNKLLSKEDKLLVAISGGADSIALSSILLDLGYKIIFAHCNFKLRGEESDQDEKFVRNFADDHGVDLHVKSFETSRYANKYKISIQMAARELRYAWFEEIRQKSRSKYIVVGHHKNDNIETFFINLIRGSGIRGFLGIKSKKENIIRPLLPFTRKDIELYLQSIKQGFRIDDSNTDIKYLRNNIRKNLLPLIYEMNPSFNTTFSNEVNYLNDFFNVYQQHMDTCKQEIMSIENNRCIISKEKLFSYNYPQVILREILFPYGFDQIDKIIDSCKSHSGKLFFSDQYKLLLDRSEIIILEKERYNLDDYTVDSTIYEIDSPISMKFAFSEEIIFNSSTNIATLDYNKLTFPLTIRRWKHGDYFYPLGMKSKKKLSDFFVDKKLSIFKKEECWLLCSGDNIVWVIGYRIDERFKISKNSKKAYIAELC